MLRTTEEINTRKTAEATTSAVESGQRADTGSARYGNPLVAPRPARDVAPDGSGRMVGDPEAIHSSEKAIWASR
jgi:hypothetical protein